MYSVLLVAMYIQCVILVAMKVQCVTGGCVHTVFYWLLCTYSSLLVAMYVHTVCYWLLCTYSVLLVAMYD